jgi:hypothetical protein
VFKWENCSARDVLKNGTSKNANAHSVHQRSPVFCTSIARVHLHIDLEVVHEPSKGEPRINWRFFVSHRLVRWPFNVLPLLVNGSNRSHWRPCIMFAILNHPWQIRTPDKKSLGNQKAWIMKTVIATCFYFHLLIGCAAQRVQEEKTVEAMTNVRKRLGEKKSCSIQMIQPVFKSSLWSFGWIAGNRSLIFSFVTAKGSNTLQATINNPANPTDCAANPCGTVTFSISSTGYQKIDYSITGLSPGKHGLHVHTEPIGADCASAGGHWNPTGEDHGTNLFKQRHVGDLETFLLMLLASRKALCMLIHLSKEIAGYWDARS